MKNFLDKEFSVNIKNNRFENSNLDVNIKKDLNNSSILEFYHDILNQSNRLIRVYRHIQNSLLDEISIYFSKIQTPILWENYKIVCQYEGESSLELPERLIIAIHNDKKYFSKLSFNLLEYDFLNNRINIFDREMLNGYLDEYTANLNNLAKKLENEVEELDTKLNRTKYKYINKIINKFNDNEDEIKRLKEEVHFIKEYNSKLNCLYYLDSLNLIKLIDNLNNRLEFILKDKPIIEYRLDPIVSIMHKDSWGDMN